MENFKGTQLNISFEDKDNLANVLKEIESFSPIAYKIIKDRITFDGEYFVINNVKMTREDLITTAYDVNNYELKELKEKEEIIGKYGLLNITPSMLYRDGDNNWYIEGIGLLKDYLDITGGKDNSPYQRPNK